MHYTIKRVSEMTGLSIPTLRFYDKEGLLPDLQRKESGYRIFSDQDLEAIDLIECFKQSGLTIREIRHFMSLVKQGDVTLAERLAIFRAHVERLKGKAAALQAALEHSQSTLEFYEIAVSVGSVTAAEELYSREKFLQQREEGGLIPLEKESDSESSEVALPHDDLPRSASRSDNASSMSLSIQTD